MTTILTKIASIVMALVLQGCMFSGGIAMHDNTTDTAFKRDKVIGFVEIGKEVHPNVELFVRHDSLLTQKDYPGLNMGGIKIKGEIK